MPTLDTHVCPKCRTRGCTDPAHAPRPFAGCGPRTVYRGKSYAEKKRRRDAVAWHVQRFGVWCPTCGDTDKHADGKRVWLWADHITPVGLGGAESGPLKVMCARCQRRQGAAVMMKRRSRG